MRRFFAWLPPLLFAVSCTTVDPKYDSDGDGLSDDVDCAPDDLFHGSMFTYYKDVDADGYGDELNTVKACTLPADALETAGDCDDSDAAINPDAKEIWYDGVDQNCDGNDADQDGDGLVISEDCDDTDATITKSGGPEGDWYDGEDGNCDGNDGDQDGDGWYITDYPYDVPEAYQSFQGDCYDNPADAKLWVALNGFPNPGAADVYPGAAEVYYDGLDEDCNGGTEFDVDGDGYNASGYVDNTGAMGTDCDDADPAVNPRASDYWYDGLDTNCTGNNDYDKDYDGYGLDGSGEGLDCDDEDADVNPDATELCNGVDDDCDGSTDEVCG